MKVAPMGDVKNNFGKYLNLCQDEPIFVTRNGKITAVIEYIEDSDIEDYLLERDARFRRMLERAKKENGGMSLKEYRKSRGI
jgi:hypothetical protein